MAIRTQGLDEDVHAYFARTGVRETDILRRLREETADLEHGAMCSSPEAGQLFALLIELLEARHVLEIGVFTGYATLWMARALPMDGRIIALDQSEEWTAIARRYWKQADVDYKIDLRVGDARESLESLHNVLPASHFDFVFIDADKVSYDVYYEHALNLVRVGGLIVIDNVLMGGRVLDDEDTDEGVTTVRALNAKLATDERVSISMLPVGDGITLARKL